MKKREHIDSKRDDIVRAAIKLFAHYGIDGTTIRAIGKEAGVSQAALYKHFPSKDAVALAVFTQYLKRYTQVIDYHAQRPIAFVNRLNDMVADFIRLHDEDPFGLLIVEQLYKFVYQTGEPPLRTPLEALREFLDNGVSTGELPPDDIHLSAALCLGAMQRLAALSDTGSLPLKLGPSTEAIQLRIRRLLGVQ